MIMDNYEELFKCNYLNANFQNSQEMLQNCVQDKSKGQEKLCTSDYKKIHDNISFNSIFINIKRGMSAGYSINPYSPDNNHYNLDDSENVIEGFTNYKETSFIVPNPIEKKSTKCSEGYKLSGNKCVQMCTDCKYKDGQKSFEFNEYDKCFPQGVYDGIDKQGEIKCNCGKNNQYCNDNLLNQFYPASGIMGQIKNLNNLFDFKDL